MDPKILWLSNHRPSNFESDVLRRVHKNKQIKINQHRQRWKNCEELLGFIRDHQAKDEHVYIIAPTHWIQFAQSEGLRFYTFASNGSTEVVKAENRVVTQLYSRKKESADKYHNQTH